MDSPLARVILATLGGYLIILLFLSVYDWISTEYPVRPDTPPSAERIQHSAHHEDAVNALHIFFQLPEAERAAVQANLEANLISVGQWLTDLAQSDYQILCLGEHHQESTRNFLAEEFFARFRADVLLLETTPEKLKRLINRMESGRDYFPLLDADIMRVLRSVTDTNPAINICGIEETDEQHKKPQDQSNSRDRFIAHNFWDRYQPGKRHIILFGALHCTNESNWLFQNLRSQAPLPLQDRMLNIRVVGEHQNGALEAFVYFLDEIGIDKKHFVIPDTRNLHPHIYELFQVLKRQTLDKYRSVIVFRN
jgi:hypothetical protein